jgi:peptidoglycan/LPS O-acetylase OafA/YrhL
MHEPYHGNVFTHTWSLGVEEKFYLLWPVLFFVVAKKTKARSALLAGIFLLLGFAGYVGHIHLAFSYLGLLMGCIMALLFSGGMGDGFTCRLRRVPSLVMLFILVLGFYLQWLSGTMIVAFSAATVLFLSHLIAKPTWMTAVLSSRPLVWLGRRSYSMYLVHVLCLNVFESRIQINSFGQEAVVLLAAYALAAAVAAVLFEAVEEPARRYGKRFIERRRVRAAALNASSAAAG